MAFQQRALASLFIAAALVLGLAHATCPDQCSMPGYTFPINTPQSPFITAVHPEAGDYITCSTACAVAGFPTYFWYTDPAFPNCMCLGECLDSHTINPSSNSGDVVGSIAACGATDNAANAKCSDWVPGNCSGSPCSGGSLCSSTLTSYQCCCPATQPVPEFDSDTTTPIVQCHVPVSPV